MRELFGSRSQGAGLSSALVWLGCGFLATLGLFLADVWMLPNSGLGGLAYALLVLASYWSSTSYVPLGFAAAATLAATVSTSPAAAGGSGAAPYAMVLLTIWVAAFVVVRSQRTLDSWKEEGAKWRSIAENPFDYMAILDRDGFYRYLNRPPGGVDPEELVGRTTIYDRVSPEAVPAVREALRELFESGKPAYLEVHALYQDRWYGCNLGPIERDRQVTGASLLARDITARKKTVDAPRVSEEQSRERLEVLEDIYRSVPVGHCVLDAEFRYVRINEWLAAANGAPVADHIGRRVRDLIPHLADTVERVCGQVFETQQPVLNLEIEGFAPGTRETHHWLVSYFPWRGGAGAVRGVHVVVLEVTDLRTAAQALEESEERFRAIFDNAAAGIALIGPDGRFERVNPALCQAFGYSAAELVERTVDDVTYPDDVPLSRRALAQVRDAQRKVAHFQKRYRSREGAVIWTKAMVAALNDSEKPPRHLIAVVADITEQLQAQQALRESEAVRRSIMDSSPDHVAMLDRDGRYLFINRVPAAYEAEALIGTSILGVVSEENARTIARTLESVAETRRPQRFEIEHQTPDGSMMWFDSNVGPVIRDGEVAAFIINSRDVTEANRAEIALKESEDRYRKLIELSPNAILLDKNDRIVYVNGAGVHLFGAPSAAQLIGKSSLNLLGVHSHSIVRQRVAGLRKNRDKPVFVVGKIARLDGLVRDVEIVASTIVDHGEPAVQVVLRDITERKKAEESLARSEQHFRSLIENSLDVFSILNRDGTSRYQSPSLTRVLGYRPEELDGKNPFDLVHPDDVVFARSRFCEALRVPGTQQPIELRMRHRDGSWRTVEVVPNNQLGNPAVDGIVVTTRDVTERQRALDEKRQLESQLWQAQKLEALGVLAGGIAHDFNNLLTAVVGFTMLAAEDLPAGSQGGDAKSHLGEAIDACGRARELVQQMLTFGRRDTHRTQAVDIAAKTSEALKLLRATIPKTIEIRERIEPCGNVLADPVQLQRVLLNLSTNAYQAMVPGPGTLYVELGAVSVDPETAATVPGLRAGNYARLIVRDNGPGIDPAIQSRIFEPFFTTKEVGKGSGLGLSVVHGIIASHGGAIQVESSPGEGACFSLYFPRLREAAAIPTPRDQDAEPVSAHVLFVDDEESVVRLGRQILERLGYRVTALKHGASSLDLFRSQPESFDLVISDISMPEMSGVELAAAIRQIRPDVPVILTTGFHRQVTLESAQRLGVKEVLFKPFTAEQLGHTIQSVLTGNGADGDGTAGRASA